MFNEMIPATVDWVIENLRLQVYSVRITEAKGGPMLMLAAHYPWNREKIEPLTEEESSKLRKQVKEDLQAKGYKAKIQIFSHAEVEEDCNDFRIKILLKAKDIDPEEYARIVKCKEVMARRPIMTTMAKEF